MASGGPGKHFKLSYFEQCAFPHLDALETWPVSGELLIAP